MALILVLLPQSLDRMAVLGEIAVDEFAFLKWQHATLSGVAGKAEMVWMSVGITNQIVEFG